MWIQFAGSSKGLFWAAKGCPKDTSELLGGKERETEAIKSSAQPVEGGNMFSLTNPTGRETGGGFRAWNYLWGPSGGSCKGRTWCLWPSWHSSMKDKAGVPCQITQGLCLLGSQRRNLFHKHGRTPGSLAPFPWSAELCGAASLTFKLSHLLKGNKARPVARLGQTKLSYGLSYLSVPLADAQEQDEGESLENQYAH